MSFPYDRQARRKGCPTSSAATLPGRPPVKFALVGEGIDPALGPGSSSVAALFTAAVGKVRP